MSTLNSAIVPRHYGRKCRDRWGINNNRVRIYNGPYIPVRRGHFTKSKKVTFYAQATYAFEHCICIRVCTASALSAEKGLASVFFFPAVSVGASHSSSTTAAVAAAAFTPKNTHTPKNCMECRLMSITRTLIAFHREQHKYRNETKTLSASGLDRTTACEKNYQEVRIDVAGNDFSVQLPIRRKTVYRGCFSPFTGIWETSATENTFAGMQVELIGQGMLKLGSLAKVKKIGSAHWARCK